MTLTLLLGMNNPLSDNARYALAPFPVNSAGWRLWRMIADVDPTVGRSTYQRGFERRNVLAARDWTAADARAAAPAARERMLGRRTVVLGMETARVLGLPTSLTFDWIRELDGSSWCLLPHPSGRTRAYNDPHVRAAVGALLLRELCREPQDVQGPGDTLPG